jgi:hypothetical protein
MKVSIDSIRELLSYDPESGKLFWKNEQRGGFKKSVIIHRAGDEAGCTRPDGRRVVRVGNVLLMAYRVAWAIHYGEWPKGEIDHINGDRSDDRISNLRDVPRGTNQENIRSPTASKQSSSYLGVYRNKRNRNKPWRAAITVNGRQIYLGAFDSECEASRAYVAAKRRLHDGCTI